ncbi:hypothetical protein [Desulfofalx alkaliphila]|uniref:hypothetical protein n=1 Tax=Desulfofalx alkaliphila TaxID=105483 RepID=UPI0004E0C159|nr:hypothetical protein [Desulfofalx alkaliphila]
MTEKQKKPIYKRWWFIALVIIVVIGALGSSGEEAVEDKNSATIKEKDEAIYEITGGLNVEFEDGKAVVTITTNAIDGSIFETLLMDGNLNFVSDFITIENGVGVKEFDIPEEWEVGYISGSAMMRFNLDEHPQPDKVKEVYGENGENLRGDLAVENNVNGYNINLDVVTAPYPDEETLKTKLNELFANAMNELIKSSNGVVVNIQPHFKDGDWSSVAVTVSDAWYFSQEYEKERFAEQVGGTIETIVKSAGVVSSDELVTVYFYDVHGKELASPKLLGGYKIKR